MKYTAEQVRGAIHPEDVIALDAIKARFGAGPKLVETRTVSINALQGMDRRAIEEVDRLEGTSRQAQTRESIRIFMESQRG